MRRILIPALLVLSACGDRNSASRDTDLVLLHVTDPRMVAAAADEAARTNQQAFAAAVQRFQSRPGYPAPPTLLVVSGALSPSALPATPAPSTGTTAGTRPDSARPGTGTQPGTQAPAGTGTQTTAGTQTTTGTQSPTATQPEAGTQTSPVTVDTQGVSRPQAPAPAQNPAQSQPAPTPNNAAPNAGGAAGLGPTETSVTLRRARPHTAAEADELARLLGSVPVSDIFLVAAGDDDALVDSLRARPLPNGTRVHNLGGCYRAGTSKSYCSAAVANTHAFVGYAPGTTAAETLRRLVQLDSLVDFLKEGQGRQVVVVAAGAPPRTPVDSTATRTDTAAAEAWTRIVGRAQAVIGGEDMPPGKDSPKLVRTPALGSDQPLASLSATRSAGYVRLGAENPRLDTLRYRAAFTGAEAPAAAAARRSGWIRNTTRWLWNMAPDASDMARAVVLAIAFLAAYLTIAALWRLQEGGTVVTVRQTTPAGTVTGAAPAEAPTTVTTSQTSIPIPTLAFDNNFSRTVLSGLAGLVVLTFMKNAWENVFPRADTYYVIWFVALFLALLVSYALVRGLTEVLRSRLAAPAWSRPRGGGGAGSHASDLPGRAWRWVLSLRGALLVFLDTVLAILLGRNQLRSAVWEDTIINLQWSLYSTLERERQDIERALRDALEAPAAQAMLRERSGGTAGDPFRVGISLMSLDESRTSYVVMSRGSLASVFTPKSMAWVAAKAGVVRWWKEGQELEADRVLYAGPLGAETVELKLKDYFEPRTRSSYEAFVVIPLPADRRDMAAGHRKGAIHISLRYKELFDLLWPSVDPTPSPAPAAPVAPKEPAEPADPAVPPREDAVTIIRMDPTPAAPARPYANWEGIYRTEGCLGPLLENAAGVVGIVLQQFNEDIFEQHIRPYRRDVGA